MVNESQSICAVSGLVLDATLLKEIHKLEYGHGVIRGVGSQQQRWQLKGVKLSVGEDEPLVA